MAQEQSLVAKFFLKFQDAFQQSDAAKTKLKGDFQDIQKSAAVKPTVDTTALTATQSKIEELKATLTGLKLAQFSVGDVNSLKTSQDAIMGVEQEIKKLQTIEGSLTAQMKADEPKVEGFFQRLKQGAEEASKAAKQVKEEGSSGGFTGGLVGGAAAIFGEKLLDFGKDAVVEASNIEQLNTKFEVFTGSAEAAAEHVEHLKKMGAATPFEFKDLAEASTTLQAFGQSAKESEHDLQVLGDISGGQAEKLKGLSVVFGQVASAGKLQGGDLMQLINQGFNPLQEISKRTGETMMSLKDKMAAGQISFEMVKESMEHATAAGGQFHGMMEKQSQTLGGLWSTLQDTLGELLVGLISNFMPMLKIFVSIITETLGVFNELPGPIKLVVAGIAALVVAMTLWNMMAESELVIKGKTLVIDGALKAARMLGLIQINAETGAITAGVVAKGAATAATWLWNAAQTALNLVMSGNPIAIVVIAIAALVAGVIAAYKNFDGFRNIVDQVWGFLKNKLWPIVLEGVTFFAKWLNPIGLLIQGFKMLYEKVEGFRKAVDAVSGVVKKAVGWFSDLFSSEEKAKTVTDAHADAVKKLESAYEAAKKKYDEYAAGLAEERDGREKDNKQEVDNAVEMINEALGKLGMKSADEFAKARKRGFPGLDAATVKEAVENIDYAQRKLKELHASQAQMEAAQQLAGVNEDPNAKKQKAQAKAFQQMIQDQIQFNQDRLNLHEQDRTAALTNLHTLYAQAKTATITFNDEDRKMLAETNTFRVAAGQKALTEEQYRDHLRMRGLSLIRKSIEDNEKAAADALKKSNAQELSALDEKISQMKLKLQQQVKDIADAVEFGDITEAEGQKQRAQAQRATDVQILNETIDFHAKQRKELADHRKAMLDAEVKATTDQFAQMEEIAKSMPDATDQKYRLNEIAVQKGLALLELGVQQEREAAKERLAVLEDERRKKIALMEDGPARQFAIQQLENEIRIAQQAQELEEHQHTQDAKNAIVAKGESDRIAILQDSIQKENIAWQAGMAALGGMFDEYAKNVETILGNLFGWEKKEREEMSDNDRKLNQMDHDDAIAKLQDELTHNKISYERYLALKNKADADYKKKQEGNKKEELSFTQQLEKNMTDLVIKELAKRGQAYVTDAMMDIITGQAKSSSNFIASVFSTMPWFVALPIIAGGLAGIGALFSSIMPKAADGKYMDPSLGGPREDNVMIRVSGGETVVDADTTKALGGAQMLPRLKGLARGDRSPMESVYMSGNILPPVSPMLQPGFRSVSTASPHDDKLVKTLERLHTVASDLAENGVDATIREEHFRQKIRSNGQSVEAAKRTRDRTVLRRAGTTGGGQR
jgi:tape measure domain-containing protein